MIIILAKIVANSLSALKIVIVLCRESFSNSSTFVQTDAGMAQCICQLCAGAIAIAQCLSQDRMCIASNLCLRAFL
jgi:hypothetical protein